MRILVTGACGVTSRAVARSIKLSDQMRSAYLVGTDTCVNEYALYEGLFDRIYRVPPCVDPDYQSLMASLIAQEKPEVAIVIPEPEVQTWVECGMPVPALLPPKGFCRITLSKKLMHETLKDSGLVPAFRCYARDQLRQARNGDLPPTPFWLRDCGEGSTSAKAAIKITDPRQVSYWAELQQEVAEFMASDYLPGRIWACCLLFGRNELLQYVCAERLRYFMGHLVLSGISGNICLGRLANVPAVKEVAERAVRMIAAATGEPLNGLLTVDLREDRAGRPLVTEINLRHVAITSAFAQAGVNMVEAQILAAQGRWAEIERREPCFPPDNALLRDIDGLPIWVPQRKQLAVGEYVDRNGH